MNNEEKAYINDLRTIMNTWDDILIKESKSKENLAKDIDKVSATPFGSANNPVDPHTLGKDQDNKVTLNFTVGNKIEKLNTVKHNLEILEKMLHAAHYGWSEQDVDTIRKELSDARKTVDELSDTLVEESLMETTKTTLTGEGLPNGLFRVFDRGSKLSSLWEISDDGKKITKQKSGDLTLPTNLVNHLFTITGHGYASGSLNVSRQKKHAGESHYQIVN